MLVARMTTAVVDAVKPEEAREKGSVDAREEGGTGSGVHNRVV